MGRGLSISASSRPKSRDPYSAADREDTAYGSLLSAGTTWHSWPEIDRRMRQEGMLTQALTPAEFRQLIETETVRWKPVIERAGLVEK